MIIDIYLNKYKEIIQSSKKIGKTYENKSTILRFHLINDIADKTLYLDIEEPNATKYKSAALTINDGIAEFEVTNSMLEQNGILKVEAILQDNNNYVLKYPTLEFEIENSINATQSIQEENPDFVSQAQAVIDLIDTTGDGTKYLSDDGTYKVVSGGASDYNDLTNKPIQYLVGTIEEPIYMNELDTGKYLIDGICKPIETATETLNSENVLIEVLRTNGNIYVSFKNVTTNIDDHFIINGDGSSYEHNSFNYDLVQYKQQITTVSRLIVSTTLLDNSSYQVTSNPNRITLNFPDNIETGYRSNFVFKTNGTLPTFTCDYDIKWHGDAIIDNVFTMSTNKTYSIDFWKDAINLNAEVREV